MSSKRFITFIIACILLLNVFPSEVKALSNVNTNKVKDSCAKVIPGTDIVTGCYTLALRPEARGLSGKNLVEFYAKGDDVLGFVNRFYKKTLNRSAEWNGMLFWASVIVNNKNGKGIKYMVTKGFFHSSEFRSKKVSDSEFIDICYQAILNRNPDSAGKRFWLNAIKYIGRDNVVKGFVNSYEFNSLIRKLNRR